MKHLSDVIGDGLEVLLYKAFEMPKMRVTARTKVNPDIDDLQKACLKAIEDYVVREYSIASRKAIEDAWELFTLTEGEYEDAENKDDWESGFGDKLEEAITPWEPILSADWLGKNTIGIAFNAQKDIVEYCNKLGKEAYKMITYGMKPDEILAQAGIEQADIEARLEKHINPTAEEREQMQEQQNKQLDEIAAIIAERVGKDFNVMAVYDDINMAGDSDDGLALGAGQRIGLNANQVAILQSEFVVHDTDLADIVLRAIENHHKSGKGKARKAPAAKPPAADHKLPKAVNAPAPDTRVMHGKRGGAEDDSADHEGEMSMNVFDALKHCGVDQGAMAQALGVSRATYNNYSNGKTPCTPNEQQFGVIRQEVVDRINKLHEALAELDGTEAETVF